MDPSWSSTNVNEKPEECNSSKEREARSLALEKAYVHDVYQQMSSHLTESRYRAWPKVKQFVVELEPGSVICDVGCGNGKYLSFNPFIYKIGLDRCLNLTTIARNKDHEVLICDNLALPFRDECFDAVLSVAVIHHFATTERRVAALKELARVLRIGGRLMVSVWAMEQRHRRFESQDVLVPWNRPMVSSSDDKTSSIERDLNSTTTTTSDDDATHYHAYTQTSDSDSFPSLRYTTTGGGYRKRGRIRHRGRSIDPTCPSSSQSSSDLSSPNESCYSFVRRALQKLAGAKRNRGGRKPWFLQGLDIPTQDETHERMGSTEDEGIGIECGHMNSAENFMPIELRQLESNEFTELFDEARRTKGQRGILFSNVLHPRRRRTLETSCEIHQRNSSPISAQPKSKSLSDLFGLIPVGMLRSHRKSTEDLKAEKKEKQQKEQQLLQQNILDEEGVEGGVADDPLTTTDHAHHTNNTQFSDCFRHKAVQTDSFELIEVLVSSAPTESSNKTSCSQCANVKMESLSAGNSLDSQSDKSSTSKKLRPVLVKQKQSISSSYTNTSLDGASCENGGGQGGGQCDPTTLALLNGTKAKLSVTKEDSACWGDMKKSVKNLPEFKQPPGVGRAAALAGSSFWKQTSLNEELIFSERLKEKEKLKQHIQKQCSLNEELIYKRQENTRWDQMKEAFLNSSNVKCLQLLKNGLSNRFRGGTESTTATTCGPEGTDVHLHPSMSKPPTQPSSSLRHGLVRILQNWKQGEDGGGGGGNGGGGGGGNGSSSYGVGGPTGMNPNFLNSHRVPKEGSTPRRGLFPPFFLRRSSAGSLNLNKGNSGAGNDQNQSMSKKLSPPHLKRRPSDNELMQDGGGGGVLGSMNGNCSKLLPGVRHVRKLSREEGSDSSKDSSFQSDTSVDSEDSFASVIFIPKSAGMDGGVIGDTMCFSNSETRANSTDSDRSPKSPASRLSPPNHVPKSPSPLACEIIRRPSPDMSPSKDKINLCASEAATKFVFDESATKRLSFVTPAAADLLPLSITISREAETECPGPTMGGPSAPSAPYPQNVVYCASHGPTLKTTPTLEILREDRRETEVPATPPPTTATTTTTVQTSRRKVEKIEVLRKPGVLPDKKTGLTRGLVRRSFPKALAVELFNPETDDADTSDTSSSSPNSVSSVVSVVNENVWPLMGDETDGDHNKRKSAFMSKSSQEDTESSAGGSKDAKDEAVGGGEGMSGATGSSSTLPRQSSNSSAILLLPTGFCREENSAGQPENDYSTNASSGSSYEAFSDGGKDKDNGNNNICSNKNSTVVLLEKAANAASSLESLVSQSSPKMKRKLTLARLGSTSEWLSSLPSDVSGGGGGGGSHSSLTHSHSQSSSSGSLKRGSTDRRHAGEKILLGEVKKFQPKGPDAKWPSCIVDDSPPQTAKPPEEESSPGNSNGGTSNNAAAGTTTSTGGETSCSASNMISQSTSEMTAKLMEEMEEKDSLFDSMENLNSLSKQHPSRNPSIDSSVRMSSTCSCSIRGGDSFDSWTSAKSSFTNSSSTNQNHHHKTSLPSIIPVQVQFNNSKPTSLNSAGGGVGVGGGSTKGARGGPAGSKSSTGGGAADDTEDSTALTYHRYYHVFREGELDKLIEKYVQNLHIISSYYDHANWCIIAEKVQVWTI